MVYAVKNINGITCLSVQKHNKYWLPASDVEGTVSYKKDNLTYTITNDKNKSNDITTPNNRKITLVHNAYVYDVKGKRVNKNVGEYFIRKGTVLFSYGIRTIKGKKYYNLGNDQYIKTSNVTNVNFESSPRPLATTSLSMSTDFNKPNLTLKRNTYLYNIKGNRIYNYLGYSYIKKNATINFYNKKKINGKLYYYVGNDAYVKGSNVGFISQGKKITQLDGSKKSVKASLSMPRGKNTITLRNIAYPYNSKGNRISNYLGFNCIKKGTVLNYYGTKKINGKMYYDIGNGAYVNITDVEKITNK